MKKHSIVWILVAAAVLVVGMAAQAAGDRVADAKAFVGMLKAGQFEEARALCDDTIKQVMSTAQLQQAWDYVAQQVGAFGGISTAHLYKRDPYDIVQLPSKFGATPLDIWVIYNQAGQISGFWTLKPSSGVPGAVEQAISAKSPDALYKAPAYARNERFEEWKVFVNEEGEWELPGTLTIPKGQGPFPAVVLVHGSGPNDRDESLGPNKPFRDIAWGLASKGIAVLRYDKRTKVHPLKVTKALTKLTVKEETIDDALAAVKVLRSSNRIDKSRVYVLGHSLGGMLIPRIGQADPTITGLISLAGATRPLEDIMLEQVTYIASLKGSLTAGDKKEMEKLKADVAKVKALKPSSKDTASIMDAPPSYWLDLKGYQPAEAAKALKQPMLIMQGGRDYQVTEVDFNNWKNALSSRTDVTFKLYPDLNHLFITGTGRSTPSEYEKPGNVAQQVVDDIAAWINAR